MVPTCAATFYGWRTPVRRLRGWRRARGWGSMPPAGGRGGAGGFSTAIRRWFLLQDELVHEAGARSDRQRADELAGAGGNAGGQLLVNVVDAGDADRLGVGAGVDGRGGQEPL